MNTVEIKILKINIEIINYNYINVYETGLFYKMVSDQILLIKNPLYFKNFEFSTLCLYTYSKKLNEWYYLV